MQNPFSPPENNFANPYVRFETRNDTKSLSEMETGADHPYHQPFINQSSRTSSDNQAVTKKIFIAKTIDFSQSTISSPWKSLTKFPLNHLSSCAYLCSSCETNGFTSRSINCQDSKLETLVETGSAGQRINTKTIQNAGELSRIRTTQSTFEVTHRKGLVIEYGWENRLTPRVGYPFYSVPPRGKPHMNDYTLSELQRVPTSQQYWGDTETYYSDHLKGKECGVVSDDEANEYKLYRSCNKWSSHSNVHNCGGFLCCCRNVRGSCSCYGFWKCYATESHRCDVNKSFSATVSASEHQKGLNPKVRRLQKRHLERSLPSIESHSMLQVLDFLDCSCEFDTKKEEASPAILSSGKNNSHISSKSHPECPETTAESSTTSNTPSIMEPIRLPVTPVRDSSNNVGSDGYLHENDFYRSDALNPAQASPPAGKNRWRKEGGSHHRMHVAHCDSPNFWNFSSKKGDHVSSSELCKKLRTVRLQLPGGDTDDEDEALSADFFSTDPPLLWNRHRDPTPHARLWGHAAAPVGIFPPVPAQFLRGRTTNSSVPRATDRKVSSGRILIEPLFDPPADEYLEAVASLARAAAVIDSDGKIFKNALPEESMKESQPEQSIRLRKRSSYKHRDLDVSHISGELKESMNSTLNEQRRNPMSESTLTTSRATGDVGMDRPAKKRLRFVTKTVGSKLEVPRSSCHRTELKLPSNFLHQSYCTQFKTATPLARMTTSYGTEVQNRMTLACLTSTVRKAPPPLSNVNGSRLQRKKQIWTNGREARERNQQQEEHVGKTFQLRISDVLPKSEKQRQNNGEEVDRTKRKMNQFGKLLAFGTQGVDERLCNDSKNEGNDNKPKAHLHWGPTVTIPEERLKLKSYWNRFRRSSQTILHRVTRKQTPPTKTCNRSNLGGLASKFPALHRRYSTQDENRSISRDDCCSSCSSYSDDVFDSSGFSSGECSYLSNKSMHSIASKSYEAVRRSITVTGDGLRFKKRRGGAARQRRSSSFSSLSTYGPGWEGTVGHQSLSAVKSRKRSKRRKRRKNKRKNHKILTDLMSFRRRQSRSGTDFNSLKDSIMTNRFEGQLARESREQSPNGPLTSETDISSIKIIAINLVGEPTVKKFMKGVPVETFVASSSTSWKESHKFLVIFDCRVQPDKEKNEQSSSRNKVVNKSNLFGCTEFCDQQSPNINTKIRNDTRLLAIAESDKRIPIPGPLLASSSFVPEISSGIASSRMVPSFKPWHIRRLLNRSHISNPNEELREMKKKMKNFLLIRTHVQPEPLIMIFRHHQDVEKFIDLLLFLQSYTGTNMANLLDPVLKEQQSLTIIRATALANQTSSIRPPSLLYKSPKISNCKTKSLNTFNNGLTTLRTHDVSFWTRMRRKISGSQRA